MRLASPIDHRRPISASVRWSGSAPAGSAGRPEEGTGLPPVAIEPGARPVSVRAASSPLRPLLSADPPAVGRPGSNPVPGRPESVHLESGHPASAEPTERGSTVPTMNSRTRHRPVARPPAATRRDGPCPDRASWRWSAVWPGALSGRRTPGSGSCPEVAPLDRSPRTTAEPKATQRPEVTQDPPGPRLRCSCQDLHPTTRASIRRSHTPDPTKKRPIITSRRRWSSAEPSSGRIRSTTMPGAPSRMVVVPSSAA